MDLPCHWEGRPLRLPAYGALGVGHTPFVGLLALYALYSYKTQTFSRLSATATDLFALFWAASAAAASPSSLRGGPPIVLLRCAPPPIGAFLPPPRVTDTGHRHSATA